MHSLYTLKKKERAEAREMEWNLHRDAEMIRSESFNSRTSELADRHRAKAPYEKSYGLSTGKDGESSVTQLPSTLLESSHIAEIAKDRHLWAVDEPLSYHVDLHSFRPRLKTAELHHGSISPSKYVPERHRIAKSLESESFDGISWSNVWDEHRGGQTIPLANSDRKLDKEIQLPLKFSPRTQKERLNDSLAKTTGGVIMGAPWSQKTILLNQELSRRSVDKRKWRAGYGKGWTYMRVVPSTAPPLGLEWNPRPVQLRERNPGADVGGRFISCVPGYLPDVVSGKWGLRQQSAGYRDHWKGDADMVRHRAELVRAIYLDKTRLTQSTIRSTSKSRASTSPTPAGPINGRMTPENLQHLNRSARATATDPSPRTRWLQETTPPTVTPLPIPGAGPGAGSGPSGPSARVTPEAAPPAEHAVAAAAGQATQPE